MIGPGEEGFGEKDVRATEGIPDGRSAAEASEFAAAVVGDAGLALDGKTAPEFVHVAAVALPGLALPGFAKRGAGTAWHAGEEAGGVVEGGDGSGDFGGSLRHNSGADFRPWWDAGELTGGQQDCHSQNPGNTERRSVGHLILRNQKLKIEKSYPFLVILASKIRSASLMSGSFWNSPSSTTSPEGATTNVLIAGASLV